MTDTDAATSFAQVYDLIYGEPKAFLKAQLDFLDSHFGGSQHGERLLLDAGCGTGRHLVGMIQRGYRVVGLDISPAMLDVARHKVIGHAQLGRLTQAGLEALPFGRAFFDGALCLESPLAFLATEQALKTALGELQRVLRPGALVVIDVFDYPATLGEGPAEPQLTCFRAPWGRIKVRETHEYRRSAALWTMTQAFEIERDSKTTGFTVAHRLHVRSADDYAGTLEDTGFLILELLPAYPGTPRRLRHEQRLIFVAQAPR